MFLSSENDNIVRRSKYGEIYSCGKANCIGDDILPNTRMQNNIFSIISQRKRL